MAVMAVVLGVFAVRFGLEQYYLARYPYKYSEVLLSCARENGLPPSLLFAVAHTESNFDAGAVSKVDARGLMQIRADTWDWAEYKMKTEEPLPYEEYAFDAEASARYGAFLIKILYDEFGSYDLALCAYHAGRGRVQEWLGDPALSPDGENVAKIPFSDTNWYVERVNKTRAIYQKLYHID